jgi:hypothetical protein
MRLASQITRREDRRMVARLRLRQYGCVPLIIGSGFGASRLPQNLESSQKSSRPHDLAGRWAATEAQECGSTRSSGVPSVVNNDKRHLLQNPQPSLEDADSPIGVWARAVIPGATKRKWRNMWERGQAASSLPCPKHLLRDDLHEVLVVLGTDLNEL